MGFGERTRAVGGAPLAAAALALLAGCEWVALIDTKHHPEGVAANASTGGNTSSGVGGGGGCEDGACERRLFLSPGDHVPCAAKPNGELYCWGGNDLAQAGIGAPAPAVVTTPARASVISEPVRYAAGTASATCALTSANAVKCWGLASHVGNGIGHGPDTCKVGGDCYFHPYSTLSDAVELVAGFDWTTGAHACARHSTGHVVCWGQCPACGVNGEAAPVNVANFGGARQLAAGAGFTCALRDDGSVWCWGTNGNGELGQGDTQPRSGAMKVPGLAAVTAIGAGSFTACARNADGTFCWGDNNYGQAGAGSTQPLVTSPIKVVTSTGLGDVRQIAGGRDVICALTVAGEVFCWGLGDIGLIGDGQAHTDACPYPGNPKACAMAPVKVPLAGVKEIALGYETAYARLADGSLRAWGAGQVGQLGNGKSGSGYVEAAPVAVQHFP